MCLSIHEEKFEVWGLVVYGSRYWNSSVHTIRNVVALVITMHLHTKRKIRAVNDCLMLRQTYDINQNILFKNWINNEGFYMRIVHHWLIKHCCCYYRYIEQLFASGRTSWEIFLLNVANTRTDLGYINSLKTHLTQFNSISLLTKVAQTIFVTGIKSTCIDCIQDLEKYRFGKILRCPLGKITLRDNQLMDHIVCS